MRAATYDVVKHRTVSGAHFRSVRTLALTRRNCARVYVVPYDIVDFLRVSCLDGEREFAIVEDLKMIIRST